MPARVIDSDGFAGLRALLPPTPRRALVMIDPSYEVDADYKAVLDALRDGLQRVQVHVAAICAATGARCP